MSSDNRQPRRRATNGQDRYEQILKVATRLFAEEGYHVASLEDIAREIGFTKPAIYHYFGSKEEILYEIHERIVRGARDKLKELLDSELAPVELLTAALEEHTKTMLRNLEANSVLFQERGRLSEEYERSILALESEYESLLVQLYSRGVDAGELRGVDPKIAINTLLGACNWAYRWFRPRGKYRIDDFAGVVVELLMHGYCTADQR